MKKNKEFRFNHDDLYLLMVKNNNKTVRKNIKSRWSKIASKTPIKKGLYPSAPYRITFALVQSMMQLKSQEIEDKKVLDIYGKVALKRMAMLFIDGMSVCSIGYSPLWLLAILNELTEDDETYIHLIHEDLKKYGFLELEENYATIVDLLESFSDKEFIDQSLFNYQTIGKIKDDLIKLSSYDKRKLEDVKVKLTAIWERMNKVGKYENFSVNKINGIITFDIIKRLNLKDISAKETTLMTLVDNFDHIIYQAIMDSISEFTSKGKKYYVLEKVKPFIEYYTK